MVFSRSSSRYFRPGLLEIFVCTIIHNKLIYTCLQTPDRNISSVRARCLRMLGPCGRCRGIVGIGWPGIALAVFARFGCLLHSSSPSRANSSLPLFLFLSFIHPSNIILQILAAYLPPSSQSSLCKCPVQRLQHLCETHLPSQSSPSASLSL